MLRKRQELIVISWKYPPHVLIISSISIAQIMVIETLFYDRNGSKMVNETPIQRRHLNDKKR
jgi:hypothetical protein